MKKVAIFGGTFDPIHIGHLVTASAVLDEFHLDEILFIPASVPPHKIGMDITDAEKRYEMVSIATKDNPSFSVSRIELEREGPSYTIDTVKELLKKHGKDTEFYFLAGADVIRDLPTWENVRELLKLCPFIAATRQGSEADFSYLKEFFGKLGENRIHRLITRELEISSTDIRERVAKGFSIDYIVPREVANYIKKERLYQKKFPQEEQLVSILKERLTKDRFLHSLGVARTATILAKKFGIDEDKAKIAGLLHDAGREFKTADLVREAEKRGIFIDDFERKMPLLLHGKIGARLLTEIYDIEDEDIEQAIIHHTVAGKNMTPLDKIIYIADMIEPNRKYPAVHFLRKVAEIGTLDEIFYTMLTRSIEYVTSIGDILHPATLEAREELLSKNPRLEEWLSIKQRKWNNEEHS